MNATKAIEIAKNANNKLLPLVFDAIKKAAHDGKYETFFYKLLSSSELKELNNLGYRVEQGEDKDDIIVIVSWKLRNTEYPETPVETNRY